MTGAARIPAVDLARGAALLGMAVYHLTYDLALFGFIGQMAPFSGFWWFFARAVAGSFLFLSGLSLWLAHGQAFRPRAFLRRLGIVTGAALLVTGATYAAIPDQFVYFGILHSIAVASILGLAFLRVPWVLNAALAIAILLAPGILRDAAFNLPWLWWTGLSPTWRPTADFEPLLPWFGPFLGGLALGQSGLVARLGDVLNLEPSLRALAWAGRHSLAIYLMHQPVLMALVWSAARVLR